MIGQTKVIRALRVNTVIRQLLGQHLLVGIYGFGSAGVRRSLGAATARWVMRVIRIIRVIIIVLNIFLNHLSYLCHLLG